MKNLYISLIATGLVACGSSKNNPAKPAATNNKPALVGSENPVIVAAVSAYKEQGYDPNTDENKALADDLIGAEILVSAKPGEALSVEPQFAVLVGSTCEHIYKSMWGNSGKSTPVTIVAPGLNGDEAIPEGYANLENKCIGLGGGCETVAVLFSKQKDRNGGKAAQVVIAFSRKEDGSYQLVGWPTTKKDAYKTVTESAPICVEREKQAQQKEVDPTQKPEPKI